MEPIGPIAISSATTLKAKAFRSGWTASSTNTATYTFSYGTLPTPTASPSGGAYTGEQTVTLSLPGGPGGAVIRYTLDGTAPSASSPLYTAPILLAGSVTLKAEAFHPDYTAGGTLTAAYTLTVDTPTFTRASGSYPGGEVVAIASATPNATIRYTLNGATPTANDAILAPGATLTIGRYTLKASAWRTGFTTSAVATATYDLDRGTSVTTAKVAAGGTHTLTLRDDGTVWGTGNNGWGMLGDGTVNNRSTPGIAAGLTGIRSVSAGANHSLAAGIDGRLYAWGQNTGRQLGDNTSVSYRSTPTLITGVPAIKAVAAGGTHSLALSEAGEVYAWGYNGYGQVGNGTTTTANVPVLIAGLSNVVGIAAGDSHSLAWTASGQLYAWGSNGNGRLGDGTSNNRNSPVLISGIIGVAEAAAGTAHSIARTGSGQVRTWGRNFEGQIGDATTTDRNIPTLIAALSGVQAVGAGANHSLAATATATFAWGANGSSQVGDGMPTNRTSPVQLTAIGGAVGLSGGTSHSVALDGNGLVWTWGNGGAGQVGNGGTANQTTPAPISGGGQTWGVAAPTATVTPAAQPDGTFTSEPSVTLSTLTAGATIRYTITGADPVGTDPIAGAPITITQDNVTVKAKAWKGTLAPSPVTAFTYRLRPATPTADPGAGSYTAPQTVTLATTTPGATIRYTLDGTALQASSPAYVAGTPVAVTESLTLRAAAYKAGWQVSDAVSVTYDIRPDHPPVITARIRPGVNAAGWTMGLPATVTFICRDTEGSLPTCSAPIEVTEETASYPFTGTATDVGAHTVSVSGVLKVDATPPVVALTAPLDGAEVSTPFVTLSGTASDALSGLAAVRCNDVVATVSNGNVTCDVPLRPGRNPIVLQASDVAGHSTSVGIVVWRTATLDRLTLSPQQATLHEGDEMLLRLVNNMGRVQTGATWDVGPSGVVEVVEAPEPTLRALGPGTATVTATVGSFTATSTVTVVGATIVFAPGTTRWVVQSTPGLTLDEVIYTNQTGPDVPEAVLLESAPGGDLQLRGVTDGRTTSITPISGDRPAQTMGDSFGGVILVQTVDTHSALQRVGFTPDVLPWRWLSNGSVSRVVQTHDGTIFATERVVDGQGMLSTAAVVVLEGATGALRARVPIPTSTHYDHWVSDGSSNCAAQERDIRDGIGLSDQWALTTADVYGVIAVDEDQASDNCSAPNEYQGHIFRTQYLLTVDRDGGSTSTQVSDFNAVFPSSSGNSSTPRRQRLGGGHQRQSRRSLLEP